MKIFKSIILIFTLLFPTLKVFSCTIVSAKDKKGQVWAGNNEDCLFTFKNFINIVPAGVNSYGYMYLTYNDPNEFMQGGMNEAGLFFDYNAVPYTKGKDNSKKDFYPGGNFEMFEYIMEHLTTVQEVMDLYKKYNVPGIEYGQLHLADKHGNLGIIVADSMWITTNNYLASTNYNLCHADRDGENCFRMPIAVRLLKSNEPSFELFTQICDSTHQYYSSGASTIYSNIHNLSTGEIWFYFGLDYKNPYKTSLKELLSNGKTSFYICDLFRDQTLVKSHIAAENKDYQTSIQLIESIQDSTERSIITRLLVTGLIDMEANFDAYPIFEYYLKQIRPEQKDYYINGITLYCRGQKEKAIRYVEEGLKVYPNDELLLSLKNQLNGKFPSNANYRLELNGFNDAEYVLLEGISVYKTEYFLVKEGDKWIAEYFLPPDEYFFRFNVDGEIVTSPQFEATIWKGSSYNRVLIKKSVYRNVMSKIFNMTFRVK